MQYWGFLEGAWGFKARSTAKEHTNEVQSGGRDPGVSRPLSGRPLYVGKRCVSAFRHGAVFICSACWVFQFMEKKHSFSRLWGAPELEKVTIVRGRYKCSQFHLAEASFKSPVHPPTLWALGFRIIGPRRLDVVCLCSWRDKPQEGTQGYVKPDWSSTMPSPSRKEHGEKKSSSVEPEVEDMMQCSKQLVEAQYRPVRRMARAKKSIIPLRFCRVVFPSTELVTIL